MPTTRAPLGGPLRGLTAEVPVGAHIHHIVTEPSGHAGVWLFLTCQVPVLCIWLAGTRVHLHLSIVAHVERESFQLLRDKPPDPPEWPSPAHGTTLALCSGLAAGPLPSTSPPPRRPPNP